MKIAIAAAALLFTAGSAHAAILSTQTDPAGAVALIGAGATVVDFEDFTPGVYASATRLGLTITPDTGDQFIDGDFAGQYNNFGSLSLHNDGSESFGALTFEFDNAVNGFGFFFGASDISWKLTTYDVGGNVLDSLAIGPTYASNAGDFFYTLDTIKSATLVGHTSDYIFIDNVTFGGASGVIPEPATWAMLITGFGLVGFAARRRRLVPTPA